MAAKIRKGDTVVVLAGRDKGREGEVLKVLPAEGRAVVQGVNVRTRHQRPSQFEQGGLIRKELPVDLSNLAIKDPTDGKPTRVGFKTVGEGEAAKKVRFSKRSGEIIDV